MHFIIPENNLAGMSICVLKAVYCLEFYALYWWCIWCGSRSGAQFCRLLHNDCIDRYVREIMFLCRTFQGRVAYLTHCASHQQQSNKRTNSILHTLRKGSVSVGIFLWTARCSSNFCLDPTSISSPCSACGGPLVKSSPH